MGTHVTILSLCLTLAAWIAIAIDAFDSRPLHRRMSNLAFSAIMAVAVAGSFATISYGLFRSKGLM